MYTTEKSYCDFVVYSKTELFVERIVLDSQFLIDNLHKAYVFHYHVIIPELLAKWYSHSRDAIEQEFWCYCKTSNRDEEMIRCSIEDCAIKWFHLQCVTLSSPELGPL